MPVNTFEYLSTNLFIPYPFVEKVASPVGFEGLFADACCTGISPTGDVSVYSMSLTEIVLKTGSTVVFTGTSDNLRTFTYGPWKVFEWTEVNGTTFKTAFFRIIVKEALLSTFTWPVSPVGAVLESTVFHRSVAGRLTSFVVSGTRVIGDITLVGGFNTVIAADGTENLAQAITVPGAVPAVRPTQKITIDSGLGVRPADCGDVDLKLYTINGVKPVNGDIQLTSRGCYWIDVPGTLVGSIFTPTASKIQLHNDCKPPCSCEDYVRVYKALKAIWERGKVVAARVEQTRQEYHTLRQQWMEEQACRQSVPVRMDLRASARPDFNVSSVLTFLNTGGEVYNDSHSTISVPITVVCPDTVIPEYVPGSGRLDSDSSRHVLQSLEFVPQSPTTFLATFTFTECIPATRWLRYSFDLFFKGSSRTGAAVTISADYGGITSEQALTLFSPHQKV